MPEDARPPGTCHHCSARAIPQETLCARCKAAKRQRYWHLIRSGLCARCTVRPARAGKRTCTPCALILSAYGLARYRREVAAHICHTCHRRKMYGGRSQCLQCYLKRQRRARPVARTREKSPATA